MFPHYFLIISMKIQFINYKYILYEEIRHLCIHSSHTFEFFLMKLIYSIRMTTVNKRFVFCLSIKNSASSYKFNQDLNRMAETAS